MSNAVNRCDPAEKAERHIELCGFYVAAVHGCSRQVAMSDYEDDFDRLHDESQDLTSLFEYRDRVPTRPNTRLRRFESEIL